MYFPQYSIVWRVLRLRFAFGIYSATVDQIPILSRRSSRLLQRSSAVGVAAVAPRPPARVSSTRSGLCALVSPTPACPPSPITRSHPSAASSTHPTSPSPTLSTQRLPQRTGPDRMPTDRMLLSSCGICALSRQASIIYAMKSVPSNPHTSRACTAGRDGPRRAAGERGSAASVSLRISRPRTAH